MSERKSWDVQRKQAPAPVQAPALKKLPVKSAPRPVRAPKPEAEPTKPARKSAPQQVRSRATPPGPGTLRERRQKRRRDARYVWLVVLVIAIMAAVYALWLPALRIQTVEAFGPDAETTKSITRTTISGTYWYVVPRNSIFFYPKKSIRSAVLDGSPNVSAVSIARTSLSSIEVHTTPRAQSFIWCGASIDAAYPGGTCWNADIEGLIFSQSTEVASSTTNTDNQIRVYSPLDTEVPEGQSPLRSHIASASLLPNAIKFVNAIQGLGVPVKALAIVGDEAHVWINGTTRIEYVLGQEQNAADLAASVLPTLKLPDSSIEYIDLRFPGKAYVMHYGAAAQ